MDFGLMSLEQKSSQQSYENKCNVDSLNFEIEGESEREREKGWESEFVWEWALERKRGQGSVWVRESDKERIVREGNGEQFAREWER